MNFNELEISVIENCYGGFQRNTKTIKDGIEGIWHETVVVYHDEVEYDVNISYNKESMNVINREYVCIDFLIDCIKDNCFDCDTLSELVEVIQEDIR